MCLHLFGSSYTSSLAFCSVGHTDPVYASLGLRGKAIVNGMWEWFLLFVLLGNCSSLACRNVLDVLCWACMLQQRWLHLITSRSFFFFNFMALSVYITGSSVNWNSFISSFLIFLFSFLCELTRTSSKYWITEGEVHILASFLVFGRKHVLFLH